MEGKFLKEASDATISIIFSLDEKVGALAEGLKIFKVGTKLTPPSPLSSHWTRKWGLLPRDSRYSR
jgi:hypothetical protein